MISSAPFTTHVRFLAVLLVALPALTGLVVCPAEGSVTMSWGSTPCPRKSSAVVGFASLVDAAPVCVVVPDGPDALLAEVSDVRAPEAPALTSFMMAPVRPAVTPEARPDGPRGPPASAVLALRTTVLRI